MIYTIKKLSNSVAEVEAKDTFPVLKDEAIKRLPQFQKLVLDLEAVIGKLTVVPDDNPAKKMLQSRLDLAKKERNKFQEIINVLAVAVEPL